MLVAELEFKPRSNFKWGHKVVTCGSNMGLEHVLFISDYFKLWANVYQLVNVTKISGFLVSFLKNSRLAIPETIFLHGNNEHELAEWQLFLSRHGTTHTTSYCLTLSGLQLRMLPPGPNRHHSLQFLLLRLSFVPSFWAPTRFSL